MYVNSNPISQKQRWVVLPLAEIGNAEDIRG
jgi:hypothetical protein